MAVLLVTYDLKAPGRNYGPVHDYLKTFTYCKGLDSVWLLDTEKKTAAVRDHLKTLVDSNDEVFVVRLMQSWATYNYYCGEWLESSSRTW